MEARFGLRTSCCQPPPRRACPLAPCFLQGATVLNHVTWSPLAQFQHAPVITGPPTVSGGWANANDPAAGGARRSAVPGPARLGHASGCHAAQSVGDCSGNHPRGRRCSQPHTVVAPPQVVAYAEEVEDTGRRILATVRGQPRVPETCCVGMRALQEQPLSLQLLMLVIAPPLPCRRTTWCWGGRAAGGHPRGQARGRARGQAHALAHQSSRGWRQRPRRLMGWVDPALPACLHVQCLLCWGCWAAPRPPAAWLAAVAAAALSPHFV